MAGDREAQAALVVQYRGLATATAYRILGPDDELEDVVQEGLSIAVERLPSLREPLLFPAWLKAVVASTAIDALRARQRRRALARTLRECGAVAPQISALALWGNDSLDRSTIERLVMALDDDARELLTLRHWEGLSLCQVAERIGCSLATAKRRLAQARDAFLGLWGAPDGAALRVRDRARAGGGYGVKTVRPRETRAAGEPRQVGRETCG